MSRTLCRTAESPIVSRVLDAYFERPEGAHRPLKTLAGITLEIALGVVTFIALGNGFGVLILLTDSAAPAGVIASFPADSDAAIWWQCACQSQSPG
jgi:hypothetical protein